MLLLLLPEPLMLQLRLQTSERTRVFVVSE
jgi:hypothetical protein